MKTYRRLISKTTLCGLLLWPALSLIPAQANDSAFSGVSGTPKPLKGEHRFIAMQSEKVKISTDGKTYDTVVDFIFKNSGPATSVQMGFPESSYGDVEAVNKTTFLKFATYVEGRKVAARRIVTSGSDGDGEVEAYWLKTVKFDAHQIRHVRVAYSSPLGGNTEWGSHRALTYSFTGQNWKGQVDRSDLEVHITQPGLWIGLPQFEGQSLGMMLQTNPKEAIFRKTWTKWQAQGYFMLGLTKAVPFWMMDPVIVEAKAVKAASTFRVGPVPADLPKDAEDPHAFTRGGVDYISVSHLNHRLGYFTDDLDKYKHLKVKTDLVWNEKTQTATLIAGAKTLTFSPNTPAGAGGNKPILLVGEYGNNLFVPLDAVVKTLGIEYSIDPGKRLINLRRGSWTGQ